MLYLPFSLCILCLCIFVSRLLFLYEPVCVCLYAVVSARAHANVRHADREEIEGVARTTIYVSAKTMEMSENRKKIRGDFTFNTEKALIVPAA